MLVALALFAASLVVAAAVVIPRVVDELSERNDVTSPRIEDPALEVPSLKDVLVVRDLSTEHRDDEDVDYEQVPPLGGPHDPDWLACGAYDEPLRDENAVHDLEHGTVWITYDPDLPQDEVDALEDLLPDDGIMSPYPGLPAPVVVSVWGAQLQLDGADDLRLSLFLDALGDGSTAPEPMASCEGGTDDPRGDPEGVDA
jgi:Protein of unknown function (DUF3105)